MYVCVCKSTACHHMAPAPPHPYTPPPHPKMRPISAIGPHNVLDPSGQSKNIQKVAQSAPRVPQERPRPPQVSSKTVLKSNEACFDGINIDFHETLRTYWFRAFFEGLEGAQKHPRTRQERPRALQVRPGMPQDPLKSLPRAAKSSPRGA